MKIRDLLIVVLYIVTLYLIIFKGDINEITLFNKQYEIHSISLENYEYSFSSTSGESISIKRTNENEFQVFYDKNVYTIKGQYDQFSLYDYSGNKILNYSAGRIYNYNIDLDDLQNNYNTINQYEDYANNFNKLLAIKINEDTTRVKIFGMSFMVFGTILYIIPKCLWELRKLKSSWMYKNPETINSVKITYINSFKMIGFIFILIGCVSILYNVYF